MAIEIEDQILLKRAHHPIGIDHMVSMEFMVDKVTEAGAGANNPGPAHHRPHHRHPLGRHGGCGTRRCEAHHKAGADLLLGSCLYTQEAVRYFGERLPHPLVTILKPGGLASLGMSLEDLAACGFKLLIDPATPALAAYEAMKKVYTELAEPGFAIRSRPQEDFTRLQKEQQASIDIDRLIEIERRTTEKPA